MSDIRRRLSKLEQKMRPGHTSRCRRCGFPETAARTWLIATDKPMEPRTCEACGRQLDLNGRPVPRIEDERCCLIIALPSDTIAAL